MMVAPSLIPTLVCSVCIFVAASNLVHGELSEYHVNWCHCDMDRCLQEVLTAIIENTTLPDCSPEPASRVINPLTTLATEEATTITTTTATTTTTTAATTINATTTITPDTNTTDTNTNDTNTTDTNSTDINSTDTNSTDTNTTANATQQESVRRKRSVEPYIIESDGEEMVLYDEVEEEDWTEDNYENSQISRSKRSVDMSDTGKVIVGEPFRRVDKTVEDMGVMFDQDHNASTCSCAPGSRVSLSLCIKNLEFEDSLSNNQSSTYKYYSYLFMATIHKYMMGLKNEDGVQVYRRLEMPVFTNRSDSSTLLNTYVHLSLVQPRAAYYVTIALEVPIGPRRRIAGYKTSIDCLHAKDVTPKEPLPPRELYMYILLLAAFGILVVLLLLLCVGRKQAFYMRFW